MPEVDESKMTDRELGERGKVRLPDGSVGTQLQARLAGHSNLVGVPDHPLGVKYDQPVFPTAVTGVQAAEIVVVEDKESGFDPAVAEPGDGSEDEGPQREEPRRVRRG